MQTVVEPGDWEHACCGSPHERNSVVELTRLVVPRKDGTSRYVERHHDLDSRHPTTTIRGRVAAIHIRHQDGSTEQLERLPVTSSDMELHLDEFPEPLCLGSAVLREAQVETTVAGIEPAGGDHLAAGEEVHPLH